MVRLLSRDRKSHEKFKTPEKLPCERTYEENLAMSKAETDAHFAPKKPPPKQVIDPIALDRKSVV